MDQAQMAASGQRMKQDLQKSQQREFGQFADKQTSEMTPNRIPMPKRRSAEKLIAVAAVDGIVFVRLGINRAPNAIFTRGR
jgi:hypothetical protein